MPSFWSRWLFAVAVVTSAAGLALALAAGTPALAWMERALLEPFFGGVAPGAPVVAFERFLFGVVGGVMAGWGALGAAVARGPFARGERWAWWGLALSVGAWFLIDTAASALAGVWINVAGNVLFLAAYDIPLLATAPWTPRRRPASTLPAVSAPGSTS